LKDNSTGYRAKFEILPHQLHFPKDNHFIHNSFIGLAQKVVEIGSKFDNFTERFESLLARQARHVIAPSASRQFTAFDISF
jgi:hypothetical protein